MKNRYSGDKNPSKRTEVRTKKSSKMIENIASGKCTPPPNPTGTKVINNGEINKRIPAEQLEHYLRLGWSTGFIKCNLFENK